MLTQLSVKNHTLVESLDIEFGSGLSAITGETGAGKSILLNALGLTLGDRADFDQVRNNAKRAEIHASFDTSGLDAVQAFLEEQALDDEGECLLRRVINANGSSKAWVNGQPVTLSILRELAEQLISIHSQHEHQRLLRADTQRELLDDYAGTTKLAYQVADLYRQWKRKSEQLAALEANMEQHLQQKELLSFQVEELLSLGLEEGEFEALEEEQKQLANAEDIQSTLYQANTALSEDERFNVLNGLRQITHLSQQIDIDNRHLHEANQLLESAYSQLQEARDSLRRTSEQIQINPERLMEVDERLSAAFDLARKHRCEPGQLPEISLQLQQQQQQLGDLDTGLIGLKDEIETLDTEYHSLARELSQLRTDAAKKMTKAVQAHFNELSMEGAELFIELQSIAASEQGLEQCQFLIRTNPGQDHKPLARIASGGELSRVSLAIQVVTASSSQNPTLVFDEVDAGIGGTTATVVGKKLRDLGRHAQVICVTHLAQVASQAHNHLSVTKISAGASTLTHIKPIQQQERRAEIARMLSGNTESEHSLKHAEELLSGRQN